jgi:hypothetical protein
MRMFVNACAGAVLAIGFATAASASDAIPYPNPGFVNTQTYSFTAASTGDLTAYIVGGFSAGFDNQLGVLVDGVQQGGFGLDNHTSNSGDSIDFGQVTIGQSLVFILHNLSVGQDAYSLASMNVAYDSADYTGSHNHIYSTAYTGDPAIGTVPQGTYVAFEDEPFPGSDFNYDDESFVFTNTASVVSGGAPEPATWGLMLVGFGGLGAMMRRRRSVALTA